MRRLVMAALVAACGCVHKPALVPQERCAASGMVLGGFAVSSGGAMGVATGGGFTAVASSSSYGESFSCRRPVTREEVCEVRAGLVSMGVKNSFDTGWRNTLIGVGYLWIVPGVVLLLVFDGQRDSAADRAHAAGNAERMRCLAGG